MNNQLQYDPRSDVDWCQVKSDTLKYCCGVYGKDVQVTEAQIMDVNMQVWTALNSVGFNLNLFFSSKAYEAIQDKELIKDYIMWVCLPFVKPLSNYYVDYINGYLDFTSIDNNISKNAAWHPENEIEIYEYLYYSRRDEDIWWLLAQGIGIIKNLYEWYMGAIQTPKVLDGQFPTCNYIKDEKKALRMILFLECNLSNTNKAVGIITKSLYNNVNARKNIWQLLLPEITEDGCEYLAEKYDLSAAQIYNVVLRFIETMDGLPTGWGMDLFSKMSVLAEYCYVEYHSSKGQ